MDDQNEMPIIYGIWEEYFSCECSSEGYLEEFFLKKDSAKKYLIEDFPFIFIIISCYLLIQ